MPPGQLFSCAIWLRPQHSAPHNALLHFQCSSPLLHCSLEACGIPAVPKYNQTWTTPVCCIPIEGDSFVGYLLCWSFSLWDPTLTGVHFSLHILPGWKRPTFLFLPSLYCCVPVSGSKLSELLSLLLATLPSSWESQSATLGELFCTSLDNLLKLVCTVFYTRSIFCAYY